MPDERSNEELVNDTKDVVVGWTGLASEEREKRLLRDLDELARRLEAAEAALREARYAEHDRILAELQKAEEWDAKYFRLPGDSALYSLIHEMECSAALREGDAA